MPIRGKPEGDAMKEFLARSWWMLALQGIVALLFGALALLLPGLTLLWLVALFAAYAIITGAVALWGAVKNRTMDKAWWLMLILGLVGVAAGALAVVYPDITALALVLLMGANALVTGALEVAMALRVRKAVRNEWLLIVAGVVSILFGAMVLIFPGAGALALVWLISFYAMLSGVLLLSLAFRVKGWGSNGASVQDHLQSAH
jgi:uncharacterized membrane protein HdeD (DUF308 family)